MLTVGSLFAGIGGFDLAWARAGCSTKWYAEIEPYGVAQLARLLPKAYNVGNVTTWQPAATDSVDVLCGGFPCQPVSTAGKRKAQADARWLWPEFARLIGTLRPRYVLAENVSGLRTKGGHDVLRDLASLGYDAEWHCIPASAVGALHQRDRIWIVAYPQRSVADTPSFDGRGQSGSEQPTGSSRGQCASDSGTAVADTESAGREAQRRDCLRTIATSGAGFVTRRHSAPMADAHGLGLEGSQLVRESYRFQQFAQYCRGDEWPRGQVFPRCDIAQQLLAAWREWCTTTYWATEPCLGQLVDGLSDDVVAGVLARSGADTTDLSQPVPRVSRDIPQRVAKLKALGNAIVPQVAEFVAHLIVTDATH